jgi:hypothetical protein
MTLIFSNLKYLACRHHHNGRWEARIGRVFGNKYLYLGTYGKFFSLLKYRILKLGNVYAYALPSLISPTIYL